MRLTIGIPTFNRDNEILALVSKIVHSLNSNNLQSEVEILISSNGTKENTINHLMQFKKESNLRLILNNQNLGYDLNVLNIINNSQSSYLLLMGDDDSISEDLVKSILSVIDNLTSDHLIICNQNLYENNFQDLVGQEQFFKDLERDKPYQADELTLSSEFFAGISGLVLPVAQIKSLNLNKFVGTNWIQLAMCFELIKNIPVIVPSKGEVKYGLYNTNRTWRVLTNNISIRYVYKHYLNLNYNFINYGFLKYNEAVRSDVYHFRDLSRINLRFYFGGLDIRDIKNSLEGLLLYIFFSLGRKLFVFNKFIRKFFYLPLKPS